LFLSEEESDALRKAMREANNIFSPATRFADCLRAHYWCLSTELPENKLH